MIRIGYFGDGKWASLALSHIVERSDRFRVAFITPRYDTRDPDLKDWAERLGVPFLPHQNVNEDEFIEKIAAFGCDLFVSMSFNQILKEKIVKIPPLGFINCHAGALPFYRGRNPLNWALINGEKEFGVTVHYIDEGIDTGDIITQNMVSIGDNDNYADLLEKAYDACAVTLLEALGDIEAGRVTRKKQRDIHPLGFYCGRRRVGDEWIDWRQTSAEIHNFVRAITMPGPGARAMSGKEEFAIMETRVIPNAPVYRATPGEVVGRDERGVVVKTGDSTILVTRVCLVGDDGGLFDVFTPKWRIGKRFCGHVSPELYGLTNTIRELKKEIAEIYSRLEGAGRNGR